MDSFKFVIFLTALVAACVTLGSPVTEKELKSEISPKAMGQMRVPVLEELDKPEETDDSRSLIKRAGPGDVIPFIELTVSLLEQILNAMGDIKRKISVGIANLTGCKWEARNVYFRSGTSDEVIPPEVLSGEALLYTARKTEGPVATGVVGVMAYYIPDLRKTLAVMFSVPYDYTWYSNWWDVKLYSGDQWADQDMYEDMYYDDPFKGDGAWHDKNLGSSLKIHGSMASSGTPTLQITVKKA